jgi:hypothetical protein
LALHLEHTRHALTATAVHHGGSVKGLVGGSHIFLPEEFGNTTRLPNAAT